MKWGLDANRTDRVCIENILFFFNVSFFLLVWFALRVLPRSLFGGVYIASEM